jgi:tetratricopeptide (TPR) repeat protein
MSENGEQKLAARISLPKEDLVNPSPKALKKMEESSKILTEFTKALVYLAAGKPGDLELARKSIEDAIAEGESYDDFAGKEVLYLIASDIARRQKRLNEAQVYVEQAIGLNKNYGRGYVAQANIYYDQGNLDRAIETYEQAKKLQDQPFGAYIIEKASWGIGNSYVSQFLHVMRNKPVDWTGAIELANCALDNYQVVIDSYLRRSRPEASLREAAAWAYYYSGVVYQETEQGEIAQQVLEQASRLTDNPVLAEKAQDRLDELGE